MRPVLPPQVEDVLESFGSDEGRAGALPLEQRVGRDGRAVREALDRGLPGQLEHEPRRRDHRLLLRGQRRHLRRRQYATMEQHGIGEGTADVDAENRHGAFDHVSGSRHPTSLPRLTNVIRPALATRAGRSSSRCLEMCAISRTARRTTASFACDGFVEPLSLRTYWSAARGPRRRSRAGRSCGAS